MSIAILLFSACLGMIIFFSCSDDTKVQTPATIEYPTVLKTSPAQSATQVSYDTEVYLWFKHPMDMTAGTVTIKDKKKTYAYQSHWENAYRLTITPDIPFEYYETIYVTLETDFRGKNQISLPNLLTFSFTIEDNPDPCIQDARVPKIISSLEPTESDSTVLDLLLKFNKPVVGVDNSTITIQPSTELSIATDNFQTFTIHLPSLSEGQTYTLHIDASIKDSCTRPLSESTDLYIHVTCHTVVPVLMSGLEFEVHDSDPSTWQIPLQFDKEVILTSEDFKVVAPGEAVLTGSGSSYTLKLDPTGWKEPLYSLEIYNTIHDLCLNRLSQPYYITIHAVYCNTDQVGPYVTSSTNGTFNLKTYEPFPLSFNEPIQALDSSITLTGSADSSSKKDLGFTIETLSNQDYLLHFQASDWVDASLSNGDEDLFYITLSTSLLDECGNHPQEDLVVVITAMDPCFADQQPPYVLNNDGYSPDVFTLNIANPMPYSLTFSEAVAPLTLSNILVTPIKGNPLGVPLSERDTSIRLEPLSSNEASLVFSASNWMNRDVYSVQVAGINDLCGQPLLTPFMIQIAAFDPCLYDSNAPEVISVDKMYIKGTRKGTYTLQFNEPVVLGMDDILWKPIQGIGSLVAESLEQAEPFDNTAYTLRFHGVADGDDYQIIVNTNVKDYCDRAMLKAVAISIHILDRLVGSTCEIPYIIESAQRVHPLNGEFTQALSISNPFSCPIDTNAGSAWMIFTTSPDTQYLEVLIQNNNATWTSKPTLITSLGDASLTCDIDSFNEVSCKQGDNTFIYDRFPVEPSTPYTFILLGSSIYDPIVNPNIQVIETNCFTYANTVTSQSLSYGQGYAPAYLDLKLEFQHPVQTDQGTITLIEGSSVEGGTVIETIHLADSLESIEWAKSNDFLTIHRSTPLPMDSSIYMVVNGFKNQVCPDAMIPETRFQFQTPPCSTLSPSFELLSPSTIDEFLLVPKIVIHFGLSMNPTQGILECTTPWLGSPFFQLDLSMNPTYPTVEWNASFTQLTITFANSTWADYFADAIPESIQIHLTNFHDSLCDRTANFSFLLSSVDPSKPNGASCDQPIPLSFSSNNYSWDQKVLSYFKQPISCDPFSSDVRNDVIFTLTPALSGFIQLHIECNPKNHLWVSNANSPCGDIRQALICASSKLETSIDEDFYVQQGQTYYLYMIGSTDSPLPNPIPISLSYLTQESCEASGSIYPEKEEAGGIINENQIYTPEIILEPKIAKDAPPVVIQGILEDEVYSGDDYYSLWLTNTVEKWDVVRLNYCFDGLSQKTGLLVQNEQQNALVHLPEIKQPSGSMTFVNENLYQTASLLNVILKENETPYSSVSYHLSFEYLTSINPSEDFQKKLNTLIPDAQNFIPGCLEDTIVISQPNIVYDVNLELTVYHYKPSDLYVLLKFESTDGKLSMIDLVQNMGTSIGFIETIFDDSSEKDISYGQVPFTGTFRPKERFDSLIGKPMNGMWTLIIFDQKEANTGMLSSWKLSLAFAE